MVVFVAVRSKMDHHVGTSPEHCPPDVHSLDLGSSSTVLRKTKNYVRTTQYYVGGCEAGAVVIGGVGVGGGGGSLSNTITITIIMHGYVADGVVCRTPVRSRPPAERSTLPQRAR